MREAAYLREGPYSGQGTYLGQGAYFFFEKQPNVQDRNWSIFTVQIEGDLCILTK